MAKKKEFPYAAFVGGGGNWAVRPGQVWRATVGSDEIWRVDAVEGGNVRYKVLNREHSSGNIDRKWWRTWATRHEAMVTPSGDEPAWFRR